MSGLYVYGQRRFSQPQEPIGPDASNPLTAGLALLTCPGIDGGRAFGGGVSDGVLASVTPRGIAGVVQGRLVYPAGTLRDGWVTLVALAFAPASGDFKYLFGTAYDGGLTEALTLRYEYDLLTVATYSPSYTVYAPATPAGFPAFRMAFGRAGPAGASTTWDVGHIIDAVASNVGAVGAQFQSNTGAGTGKSRTGWPLYVGSGANVGSPWRYYGNGVLLAAAWNRRLSDAELMQIWDNPWQLFARHRMFVPLAAAGISLPTLSASTYVPGSITTSGWQPRITAS